ncbi:MAG: NAD(P)/FAD-dependent oxidoreductase [Methanomassiliicoccaceae archaeon]|jgi:geranylgeranyl reductase family protein|nr:NAD(P)/FAD-dependent oxidoreductase [Methanomassiliicoccaceae archaeon]
MTYDAIIVGGGPAGSKAASLLAKDRNVLVIEEHATSGAPVHCTGLISDEALRLSGVKPTVLNRLYGANIIFPDGRSVTVRSKEHKAVLIDRNELDTLMAEKARDDGAAYLYSARYVSHSVSDSTSDPLSDSAVRVTTDGAAISSSMIIGADGRNSKVAATIPDNAPAEYVRGIQADVRGKAGDDGMINIYVGSGTAPGFFAWEIPFGDMVRIGLCTSEAAGPPAAYLKRLLRATGHENGETIAKYCGRIPLGGRRRTYADNLLLIGDAACHVKPISGGGLQPAFRSAYALAETVAEAFDEGDLSEEFLSVYEKRWRRDVGRELRMGYRLRKMFTSLSDGELNGAAGIIGKEHIRKILDGGDIDHPSDLLLRMMRHPLTMLRLMPLMVTAGIRSIL